jgi:hypothetical protein
VWKTALWFPAWETISLLHSSHTGSGTHPASYAVEVEVNLRSTASRPVCPGVRRPSETRDHFFYVLEISFRQLRLCYFVAPSLTRVWVCNLLYNCFWRARMAQIYPLALGSLLSPLMTSRATLEVLWTTSTRVRLMQWLSAAISLWVKPP